MRNGGWLREQIDRLRRPNTKRWHKWDQRISVTFREYRRYRRQDKDGITFLGAFWATVSGGWIMALASLVSMVKMRHAVS